MNISLPNNLSGAPPDYRQDISSYGDIPAHISYPLSSNLFERTKKDIDPHHWLASPHAVLFEPFYLLFFMLFCIFYWSSTIPVIVSGLWMSRILYRYYVWLRYIVIPLIPPSGISAQALPDG